MDKFDEILRRHTDKYQQAKKDIQNDSMYLENRVNNIANFLDNSSKILKDLDKEFEEYTGLSSSEVKLLFVVAGLQVLRQFLVTKFPTRLDDQEAAKRVNGSKKGYKDRVHRLYHPSFEEVLNNPVPFDANIGSNGALKGGGKLGHRVTAIGHDPLLGLIFGTANIATSTLTNNKFQSYHIKSSNKRDIFAANANTGLVLMKTVDKIKGSLEEKKIVALAFIKEIIHLRSDIHTHHSLPLPIMSVIDGQLASKLAEYGLDFSNLSTVGQQASYAMLINYLASIYHYSLYDGVIDISLYKIKTKKIIMYSNIISSSINIGTVIGTKRYDLLDIGGISVAIFETITSIKFIKKVKREFILGRYNERFAQL